MIMNTFVEGFDFTGKTVIPFTTHGMSRLGTTVRDYTAACPARPLEKASLYAAKRCGMRVMRSRLG